jgi:hypothetical protein
MNPMRVLPGAVRLVASQPDPDPLRRPARTGEREHRAYRPLDPPRRASCGQRPSGRRLTRRSARFGNHLIPEKASPRRTVRPQNLRGARRYRRGTAYESHGAGATNSGADSRLRPARPGTHSGPRPGVEPAAFVDAATAVANQAPKRPISGSAGIAHSLVSKSNRRSESPRSYALWES